mmetsp:Transcript_24131/g.62148  ORF Transcript_24131/g.62148 Transcript_24131/m.62148 type:complete len:230 (+) Transcript_24131:885-1574(+)
MHATSVAPGAHAACAQSTMASSATKDEARLSRRPPSTNSECVPPMAGGWVSKSVKSNETICDVATPSFSASSRISSGSCDAVKAEGAPAESVTSLFAAASAAVSAATPSSWRRAARQRTGAMCDSLFGTNFSRSSAVCRWMHSDGTRSTGSWTATSRLATLPSAPRVSTMPPMPRSRSNQVCQRPPPYVETESCVSPSAAPEPCLVSGLALSAGESVCAPITLNAPPGW